MKCQIESLKNQLIFEKSRASEALTGMKEFRHHYELLNKEFEQEKQKTFIITANMTRQYKLMRDELMQKNNELQKVIDDKANIIQSLNKDKETLKTLHENEMSLKDSEISQRKKKMDDMTHEFGQMLKQTLDKMSEKIVVQTNGMQQPALNSMHSNIQLSSIPVPPKETSTTNE